jgi:hypothetical protein
LLEKHRNDLLLSIAQCKAQGRTAIAVAVCEVGVSFHQQALQILIA